MDNGALGFDIHRGRQHRLVLRKSFFRHQRARRIQFASWPFVLRAQGANVAQYFLQFILRKRIAKGRHFPGEPANRSSLMSHCKPVGVGFAGCKAAVGEIGERNIETQQGCRSSLAVCAMTGSAGLSVEFLTRLVRTSGAGVNLFYAAAALQCLVRTCGSGIAFLPAGCGRRHGFVHLVRTDRIAGMDDYRNMAAFQLIDPECIGRPRAAPKYKQGQYMT